MAIRRLARDTVRLVLIATRTLLGLSRAEQPVLPPVCSCTTNGLRPYSLILSINSIWLQRSRPQQVFVSCPDESFERIRRLIARWSLGPCEVRSLTDDRGPVEKYLAARERFEQSHIVTFDDDVCYEPDWLEQLWACHERHPTAICGHRGFMLPWNVEVFSGGAQEDGSEHVSMDIFLTGHGGILYPDGVLGQFVWDTELMNTLSARNDDIWLHLAATVDQVPKVLCASSRREPAAHPWRQRKALRTENVGNRRNATYWAACRSFLYRRSGDAGIQASTSLKDGQTDMFRE